MWRCARLQNSHSICHVCVLLVEAQIMWSHRPPKTAVATFEAFFSRKQLERAKVPAVCNANGTINPRHFELLGIPTLHVLVQPFISKQSEIKHATTTSLLRRWRDGSLDGLSSYFQPFLYFGCDFRRRAAVTGPKETSQINLYFQYKTKKEFRVSSAEHARPARACCLYKATCAERPRAVRFRRQRLSSSVVSELKSSPCEQSERSDGHPHKYLQRSAG